MASSPHFYKVKGMLISLCIRYHPINKSSAEEGMASSPHFNKVKGMLISLCIRYHLINKSSAEKGMASSPHFYKMKGMLISLCIRYHLNNKSLQKRVWPIAPKSQHLPLPLHYQCLDDRSSDYTIHTQITPCIRTPHWSDIWSGPNNIFVRK